MRFDIRRSIELKPLALKGEDLGIWCHVRKCRAIQTARLAVLYISACHRFVVVVLVGWWAGRWRGTLQTATLDLVCQEMRPPARRARDQNVTDKCAPWQPPNSSFYSLQLAITHWTYQNPEPASCILSLQWELKCVSSSLQFLKAPTNSLSNSLWAKCHYRS